MLYTLEVCSPVLRGQEVLEVHSTDPRSQGSDMTHQSMRSVTAAPVEDTMGSREEGVALQIFDSTYKV